MSKTPQTSDYIKIEVEVKPNAPRTEIIGRKGKVVVLKVHSPPVEGQANIAVIEFLADILGIAKSRIQLVRGQKSRKKVLAIGGVSEAEFEAAVGRTA
jgi:uncharacterized protein